MKLGKIPTFHLVPHTNVLHDFRILGICLLQKTTFVTFMYFILWNQRWMDSNKVHFLSTLLECYFFLETFYFNFTTLERQISYFLLHYNSVKVLE